MEGKRRRLCDRRGGHSRFEGEVFMARSRHGAAAGEEEEEGVARSASLALRPTQPNDLNNISFPSVTY